MVVLMSTNRHALVCKAFRNYNIASKKTTFTQIMINSIILLFFHLTAM